MVWVWLWYALGSLLSDAESLKAFSALQGFPLLEQTINEAAENDRLREAAQKVLDKARFFLSRRARLSFWPRTPRAPRRWARWCWRTPATTPCCASERAAQAAGQN
jgi:hypothetical protein